MDEQMLRLSILIIIISTIITLFFSWSVYTALKRIPAENQSLPSWLVWFFCIPVLGFLLQWVMLPFTIPAALKKTFSTNDDAVQFADWLFKIALASVIITTFAIFFSVEPINKIADLVGWALWFTYWLMIIVFKKKYLISK